MGLYSRMGTNSSKVGDVQQVQQVTQVKPNTEQIRQTRQTRQMMNELESDFNAIEEAKKIKRDDTQKTEKKVSYDEIQIYRHKYMPKSKRADV